MDLPAATNLELISTEEITMINCGGKSEDAHSIAMLAAQYVLVVYAERSLSLR